MSNFKFKPAVRTQTPLLIGLAGPSRSGKTYSALRLATGLAQGQPIAMIDTESGRGLHYADRFQYMYTQLDAPFTSERYMEAIEAAKAAGAKVIIVDSASHEHEGPGGMLEQHEANLDRMAGNDFKKREKMTFTAWIKPKAAHNKYVNRLLQMGADTHFIFCFRAKDKLILKKGENPISAGWTPICSSRFEFEMTSLLVLPEGSKGIPDLEATSTGLREPFDQFVKHGIQLDEALGKRLAEWASAGGKKLPKEAGGRMDSDKLESYIQSIRDSEDMEELKSVFKLAYRDASTDTDAQAKLKSAYDQRKEQLSNIQPEEDEVTADETDETDEREV